MLTKNQARDFLLKRPAEFGRMVGFKKLGKLHNYWIREMVCTKRDRTLQAHRGSYKTTCDSIALAIIAVLLPNKRVMFMRKTDDDVKEIIQQTKMILQSGHMIYLAQQIYGTNLRLTIDNAFEIRTNLTTDLRGTPQIAGMGIGGSLTGKHFDIIFTDDIVNLKDRISRAERDHTKLVFQELQNIKNPGGRFFNTGTPWHPQDAFSIMPDPERWDVYSTGMLSDEEIAYLKDSMTASLFAANYELRHIASEDVIFMNPQIGEDPAKAEQGICHIDAAYGGEDYTAFTICRKVNGIHYIYGRLWQKAVDEVEDEIIDLRKKFNGGKIYCEDNADKGYLAKSLKKKGERVVTYHESDNKFIKIVTFLKGEWKNVRFVAGTDEEYINQICDYNENAEHDDAPDSLASIIRQLRNKDSAGGETAYKSVFGGIY